MVLRLETNSPQTYKKQLVQKYRLVSMPYYGTCETMTFEDAVSLYTGLAVADNDHTNDVRVSSYADRWRYTAR